MLLILLYRILIAWQLFYKIHATDSNKWSRAEHPLTSTELSLTRTSGLHRVKNGTNFVKLTKEKVHFSCKALLEFSCKNGNCIQYSKFCDGANDCGDSSDEIRGCTKCNQTIYGEVGQKYPLRLTEPLQKFHPFLCEISFSAIGGKFGDIIELTFLSFQVGSFHIKKQKSNCENGFLKISEKATLDIGKGKEEGKFCGQLMSRKAIFYSRGNNVSLTISLSEGRGFYGQYLPLNVYLTYRYLAAPSVYNTLDFRTDFGIKHSGSSCDRVFEDCLPPRKCSIISPNYPGFYPRNITCNFLVQQTHRVPKGYRARISINQPNEYKISLFAGSSSGGKAKKGLLFDCELDSISVYDGPNVNSRKLLDFCGSGLLPPILSTKSELLVELKSGAHNVLFDSRFQLDIQIVLHKDVETLPINVCDFVYNGANLRSGLVRSQTAILSNVTCYYKFVSTNPWDRIWIYFISYLVQDPKQWSAAGENCEYSQMTIADGSNITFCEKTSPKICGRVFEAINNSYSPKAPCLYPQESYLSNGPQMTITQTHYQLSNIYNTASHFTAKFEFIDTQEFGDPIIGTLCDRRFASYKHSRGSFRSTRNLFYYGRGGQRSISCSYHFLTNLNQRLRLSLKSLKLKTSNCVQTRNPINNSYQCQFSSRNIKKRSTLIIFESMSSERLNLGCFCNSINSSSLFFDMIGTEVVLNFTSTEMSHLEDFNDFGFEASFEFLPAIDCDLHSVQSRNEKEAEITFTVPSNYDFSSNNQLLCRWIVPAAFPGKQLDLKINGYKLARENDCAGSNRYIIYSGNPWRPLVIICAHLMPGRGDEDFEKIHLSWPLIAQSGPEISFLESDSFSKRIASSSASSASSSASSSSSFINQTTSQLQVIIEIRARKHGSFNFKWVQLSEQKEDTASSQLMRKTDCLYKCPELNVCLSPDLVCDGITHCPSGYDENKELCSALPTVWIVLVSFLSILLLSLLLLFLFSRRRKQPNTPLSGTSVSRQEIDPREEHSLSRRSEYQATHEFNFRFKTEELGLENIIDSEACHYGHHCPTLGRIYR